MAMIPQLPCRAPGGVTVRVITALMAATLGACGGRGAGDTSWLLPLWVPTDVAVADVDGDGRADLVLLRGDDQALLMLQSPTQSGVFLAPRSLP